MSAGAHGCCCPVFPPVGYVTYLTAWGAQRQLREGHPLLGFIWLRLSLPLPINPSQTVIYLRANGMIDAALFKEKLILRHG